MDLQKFFTFDSISFLTGLPPIKAPLNTENCNFKTCSIVFPVQLDAYPSHIHSKDRVLVHSALHFKPCYTIDDAPLNELVKQVLDVNFNLNIDLLLAYAWPAISRGSHFVGIAPQDTKSKDLPKRRMLAYLPSLISQLCDSNSYRSLPGGKLVSGFLLNLYNNSVVIFFRYA